MPADEAGRGGPLVQVVGQHDVDAVEVALTQGCLNGGERRGARLGGESFCLFSVGIDDSGDGDSPLAPDYPVQMVAGDGAAAEESQLEFSASWRKPRTR